MSKWKNFKIFSFCVLVLLFISGCSDLTLSLAQNLKVTMYGIATSPASAEGTIDPIWQEYTLRAINFLGSDETTNYNVYSGENAEVKRIVNRPQLIFEKDIADINKTSFSWFTLTFDGAVPGASQKSETLTATLADPNLKKKSDFQVTDGKGLEITILIHWKNTISEAGLMQSPEFELKIKEN
ncbi:MAG: hypothetical protein HQK54_15345 [Oligoflexales bacterium]|nr:hypothetical protein [Oligoflexales bacterium]